MFGRRLFEATAALLLFGLLSTRSDLQKSGERALAELTAHGYQVSERGGPIRVYALEGEPARDPSHAAHWRPGIISLRGAVLGDPHVDRYLRHELMHEANARTCGGRLPVWADEASALAFSAEDLHESEIPPEGLAALTRSARGGLALNPAAHRALSALVARFGWPAEVCAVSEKISRVLAQERALADEPLSYVVINLRSGRILEEHGSPKTKAPPGSVLKIPFTAALRETPAGLATALLQSTTAFFLQHTRLTAPSRFELLFGDAPPAAADEESWRTVLGERRADAVADREYSLYELARVLRAALLLDPARFYALRQNGAAADSTLSRRSDRELALLTRLDALAKTGTVTAANGSPVMGHLMLAWPAQAPAFLAVARRGGVRGAGVLASIAPKLDTWRARYEPAYAKVRVKLLSRVPADDFQVIENCPGFQAGADARATMCGEFTITTQVRKARPLRKVFGILIKTRAGLLLETDPDTYADGVLAAEAADLQGEARKALRAVIVWNALFGEERHSPDRSLCDTTHCMVFQGNAACGSGVGTDSALLSRLRELAARRHLSWLPFSQGGSLPWSTTVTAAQAAARLHEPALFAIRRERARDGSVVIHLSYPSGEETVSCEVFRNTFKLLACPRRIRAESAGWTFFGVGAGHGMGLEAARAAELATQGLSAAQILERAYASE